MTTLKFQVAPRVGPTQPRGADVAATLAAALLAGLRHSGSAFRRRRRPVPAPARNAAEEARAVRELAEQYRLTDPRFADELVAAADRHERLHGV
jgi:hypothetical protein